MAKKTTDLLEERRAKDRAKQTKSTDAFKDMLSDQTTGKKRKYTKLQHKENKDKIVTVLLTATEYSRLVDRAEEENSKSLSEYIRQAISEKIQREAR